MNREKNRNTCLFVAGSFVSHSLLSSLARPRGRRKKRLSVSSRLVFLSPLTLSRMPQALVATPGGRTFALEGSTVAELRAALEAATGELKEREKKNYRCCFVENSSHLLPFPFLSLSLSLPFSPSFFQGSLSGIRLSATSKGTRCPRTGAWRRRAGAAKARRSPSYSASAAGAALCRWSPCLALPPTTAAAAAAACS